MQFSSILGHLAIKKRLIKSVTDQRTAHAQLFFGAEGSAALALALAYIQYIACENKSETDSCGQCKACIKMQKHIHPDVHFSVPVNWESPTEKLNTKPFLNQWRTLLNKNPFIGLDEWVEMIDIGNKQPFISNYEIHEQIVSLNVTSYESEYKFLLMWLPELMRTEGGNSLLKTLEEPPDKTLIILVTQDYDRILKTILSRTQLIKIPSYTVDEGSQVLQQLSSFGEEKCTLAVGIAEGNIAQAKWLLENNEEAEEQLNLFKEWMRACYSYNISEQSKLAEKFAKQIREWQKGFFAYALYMVRQTILLNHAESINRVTISEKAFLEKFSKFFNVGNYGSISNYLNDASHHISRNAYGKLLFFDTSLLISEVFRKEKERALNV
jgi:DNA polymerase-3 subunit delta'